jgi:hypothetical protein
MKSRKSAREKLHKEQEAKIVEISEKMQNRFGKGSMLIPRPLDVDSLIRRIEKGKLITTEKIREKLSQDYGTDVTCPLTTGIFVKISSEAAEEDIASGVKDIAPYWRVLKSKGLLNDRFPGGIQHQAERLIDEGHTIVYDRNNKPKKVKDFEKFLQDL